jgi:hypothetical protein
MNIIISGETIASSSFELEARLCIYTIGCWDMGRRARGHIVMKYCIESCLVLHRWHPTDDAERHLNLRLAFKSQGSLLQQARDAKARAQRLVPEMHPVCVCVC